MRKERRNGRGTEIGRRERGKSDGLVEERKDVRMEEAMKWWRNKRKEGRKVRRMEELRMEELRMEELRMEELRMEEWRNGGMEELRMEEWRNGGMEEWRNG